MLVPPFHGSSVRYSGSFGFLPTFFRPLAFRPLVFALLVGWFSLSSAAQQPLSAAAGAGNGDSSAGPAAAEQRSQGYDVGVAKIDITPTFPVLLSGYAGRPQELTEQVSMPLFARAIAISESDGPPAVLIAVDNCAILADVRRQVAGELNRRHGWEIERVTIASTHTHSAPMLTGALNNLPVRDLTQPERQAMDRYTAELVQKLITVAEDAAQRRQPCRLELAYGQVDFAINRRGAAAVDHRLPMLVASDRQGVRRAVMTSYACHCVSTGAGLDINGDWAGAAAAAIETSYPEATAIVLVGCGGDQNPRHRGGIEAAQQQGRALADEIGRLLGQPLRPIEGSLTTQFAEIDLPLEPLPTQDQWQAAAEQEGITGYHAQKNLQRLDRGEPLPQSVRYPIQSWTFGDDLAMVFLGGEVVVDYSSELQRQIDAERLWITAYANDVPAYIPSERVLREGGYEGGGAMVWYDLPTKFARGLQYRIIDEVLRQLGQRYTAPHDPAGTGGTSPLTPAESMGTISLANGFRIDLVAAEPLIADPVAIDFGHDGKLWVVEMGDYPEGLDGQYLPGGRIKYLEDRDGDGRYDTATTFLDQVPFPTGVTVWRDGVLISTAPDVLLARDTDGDGRADQVETVLSGFFTENYQARVNSITLGLDNWMHGAAGIFGGQLTTPGGRSIDSSNRDFRFLPGTEQLESASGRSQQGRVRDDWGNWFGSNNSHLLFHYPTTEHYHGRNPHVAVNHRWLPVEASRQLFPLGSLVQWELSGPPGAPTAACGIAIYRDRLLGDDFYGNAFICEPVNQLVHRMQLHPHGTTFVGRRAAEESDREFLASTDNWFRPVQAITGPDGGLYVVDMYRYMIEHPRFLSDAARAPLDVRAGDRLGRIYRVVPDDFTTPSPPPRLVDRGLDDLIPLLKSPNGTLRDMVHQQLLWRDDAAAVGPLTDLLAGELLPASRIQVLALLDHFDAITPAIAAAALADRHDQVRRHAVRLAEPLLNQQPQIAAAVVALADDEQPLVRQQVAYSLGQWSAPAAGTTLAEMTLAEVARARAQQSAADPHLVTALFSSLTTENIAAAVDAVFPDNGQSGAELGSGAGGDEPLSPVVEELLLLAIRIGDQATLQRVAQRVLRTGERPLTVWQANLIPPLIRAGADRGWPLPAAQQTAWLSLLERSSRIATDDQLPIAERVRALGLLPLATDVTVTLGTLQPLLAPQTPIELQQAAVATLASLGTGAAAEVLLSDFASLTPAVQATVLDAVLARGPMVATLLSNAENGELSIHLIPANHRQTLDNHPDEAIRDRWQSLSRQQRSGDLTAALDKYRQIDVGRGDRQQGRAVFEKHCAACHAVDGVGHVVGPDLRALSDRSQDGLLESIVDPNAAIDQRYATYSALTTDGLLVTGIIESESGNDVVLLGQEGRKQTILRRDLEQLLNTGISLMPSGLEQAISVAEMEHLLAYLGAAANGLKYQYLSAGSGEGNYPDDAAAPKLTDSHFGSAQFTDGSWVGFLCPSPATEHSLEFDLAGVRQPERLRFTYGVNHQPGHIRAPTVVRYQISQDGQSYQPAIEINDLDDTPDGLGPRQIDARQFEIPLPPSGVQRVRVTLVGNSGWLFLSEVEAVSKMP